MLARILLTIAPALSALVSAHPTKRDGATVINSCSVNGQAAITFDDGPFQYENQISDILTSHGAKGTFFLNGNNYACIYDQADVIKNLHAQGHTLGSHTWSHADLTSLSDADINTELERVETAFIKILGLKPIFFRPPYGRIDSRVLGILGQRGYKKVFLWSDDTGDSLGASLSSQEGALDSAANQFPSPRMILQHSPLSTTPDETNYGVPRLQSAGYKLVAVDTCLGSDGEWPYQYIGEPSQRDGSWTC